MYTYTNMPWTARQSAFKMLTILAQNIKIKLVKNSGNDHVGQLQPKSHMSLYRVLSDQQFSLQRRKLTSGTLRACLSPAPNLEKLRHSRKDREQSKGESDIQRPALMSASYITI